MCEKGNKIAKLNNSERDFLWIVILERPNATHPSDVPCQRHLRLPMPLVIQFPVNPSSWLDARGDGKVEWCGGSQAAVGIFLGMKQWQECHRFFGYFWAMSKKHRFSRIGKMPRYSDEQFLKWNSPKGMDSFLGTFHSWHVPNDLTNAFNVDV